MSGLTIRPALMGDMQECLEFDASYATEYVWQMDSHASSGEISVGFRHVRLPRSMRVEYPRDAEALLAEWRLRDTLLVAERDRVKLGYVSSASSQDSARRRLAIWSWVACIGAPASARR
jgi:hypothetical protein